MIRYTSFYEEPECSREWLRIYLGRYAGGGILLGSIIPPKVYEVVAAAGGSVCCTALAAELEVVTCVAAIPAVSVLVPTNGFSLSACWGCCEIS